VEEEVLGVAWDGTGYGSDGTIWGGEFLLASRRDFRRLTHLRPFPLPGGDLAVRQPRYAALGLLHEVGISVHDTALAAAFSEQELTTALTQLECALNTPRTSSAGRLFDAVAALLGLRWRNEFEAQAAMELEFAAEPSSGTPPPWTPAPEKQGIIDWEPTIRELLAALKHGVAVSDLAARFLEAMSRAILDMAQSTEIGLVVLSGGCFQNVRLLETTVASLTEAGFTPLWPQRTPPNDGGLALGQAVVAEARLREA
jgi:hydrogenase maturation protein HypF